MNLQEQEAFYQMMTRLKSRAAALPRDDAIVTEIVDGFIVSRPAKRYQEITNTNESKPTSEPKVIDLQEYAKSKAGSVLGGGNNINKMKVINDFINRHY
jgi:hypothetical protein